MSKLNIAKIRNDFPILSTNMNGKPLAFLDNAATTQKPSTVINAITNYYQTQNANVHRGIYALSEQATLAFENVRTKIKNFINAPSEKEIVFVRGTTEAINLVANSFGEIAIKPNDEIIITTMEHHSNIVPWQLICEKKQAKLKVIPLNQQGELKLDSLAKLLNEHTRLLAVTQASNSLGTVNPIKEIIQHAHEYNIPVLVDGAQAAPHKLIDMQALDCDFYAFSGHKMFAPTGIGVLYAKTKWLEKMPPYHGGGDMISRVTLEKSTFREIPYKFEAGTPHIEGVIGLGAAIDYLMQLDRNAIEHYETELLAYATSRLTEIKGLKIIGQARDKAAIVSFVMDCAHAHDIGTLLNAEGIAVRSGHHCSMPIMDFFEIPAATRASFAFYNTFEEIDRLTNGLLKVREYFA